MDCGTLDTGADSLGVQNLYVVLSHADGVAGIEFGLRYTHGVNVLGWTLCQSGLEILEDGWPASGTAAAVAFDPNYPTGPDSLIVIGYLTLGPTSTGFVQLTPDERIGEAQWVDASNETHAIPPVALGRADVNTPLTGYTACGAVPSPPPHPETALWKPSADENGIAPLWGMTLTIGTGPYIPIAVQTALVSDAENLDLSGAAAAYVVNEQGYHAWRVRRDGDVSTLYTLGVTDPDIDDDLNREPHLAVSKTGDTSGLVGQGWAFHVASGRHPLDSNGGYANTIVCTNEMGMFEWEAIRNGNADDELLVRCIDLHPDEEWIRTLGTNWKFVTPRRIYNELNVRAAEDGSSSHADQYEDIQVEDVLDLEATHQGLDQFVYLLGQLRSADGFVLYQVDGEPESDLADQWHVTLQSSDVEESAVLTVDSDRDAIVALKSVKTSGTSVVRIRKLSWDDGSDVWSSPVTWTSTGTASMEVMEIGVDSDDNIYVAGRFEGSAGLVKFPPDPTGPADREWLYELPDDGSLGLARAFDIDDEEACIYVTGHADDADDGTSAQQMIVSCLSLGGDVLYEHFLDADEIPAAEGSAGFSIDATTDPYGSNVPIVYALGRVETIARPYTHQFVLLRYPLGECSPAVGTPEHSVPNGSGWRVRGGSWLDVEFLDVARVPTELRVFDVGGRLVAERLIARGSSRVRIDGLTPGVYFVRGEIGSRALTARAVVVR